MGTKGRGTTRDASRHLNANDIPPLYVISISLWIKTSFEVMVKGCKPIIYKNWG